MKVQFRPRGASPTCVYCHDAAPDSASRCPGCGVRYHLDCLAEHRQRRAGCVTPGCLTSPPLPGPPSRAPCPAFDRAAGRGAPASPVTVEPSARRQLPSWLLAGLILSGSSLAASMFASLLQMFQALSFSLQGRPTPGDADLRVLLVGSGIVSASMLVLALLYPDSREHDRPGRAAGPC